MDLSAESFVQVLRDARGKQSLPDDALESVLGGCYSVLETLAKWADAAC